MTDNTTTGIFTNQNQETPSGSSTDGKQNPPIKKEVNTEKLKQDKTFSFEDISTSTQNSDTNTQNSESEGYNIPKAPIQESSQQEQQNNTDKKISSTPKKEMQKVDTQISSKPASSEQKITPKITATQQKGQAITTENKKDNVQAKTTSSIPSSTFTDKASKTDSQQQKPEVPSSSDLFADIPEIPKAKEEPKVEKPQQKSLKKENITFPTSTTPLTTETKNITNTTTPGGTNTQQKQSTTSESNVNTINNTVTQKNSTSTATPSQTNTFKDIATPASSTTSHLSTPSTDSNTTTSSIGKTTTPQAKGGMMNNSTGVNTGIPNTSSSPVSSTTLTSSSNSNLNQDTTINLDDMMKSFKGNEKTNSEMSVSQNPKVTPTSGEVNLQNLSLKKNPTTVVQNTNPLEKIAMPTNNNKNPNKTTSPSTEEPKKKKSKKMIGVALSMFGFILLVGVAAFVANTMYPEESKSFLSMIGIGSEDKNGNKTMHTSPTGEDNAMTDDWSDDFSDPDGDTDNTNTDILGEEENNTQENTTDKNTTEEENLNSFEEPTAENGNQDENNEEYPTEELPDEDNISEVNNEDNYNAEDGSTNQDTTEEETYIDERVSDEKTDEDEHQGEDKQDENNEEYPTEELPDEEENEEGVLTPFQDMETFIDGENAYKKETIEKLMGYQAQGEKFVIEGTEKTDDILVKYGNYIIKKSEILIEKIKQDNMVDSVLIEKYVEQFNRYIEKGQER